MPTLATVLAVAVEAHQRQRVISRQPVVRSGWHIERLEYLATGNFIQGLALNGFHSALQERISFAGIGKT